MSNFDISLNGLLDFKSVSVEISPISIAGTDWFEKHFGCGAVSARICKSLSSEVVESLNRNELTWIDKNNP